MSDVYVLGSWLLTYVQENVIGENLKREPCALGEVGVNVLYKAMNL